jgi:hypothetical protein
MPATEEESGEDEAEEEELESGDDSADESQSGDPEAAIKR